MVATVNLILDTRRAKNNNTYPVKLRVIYQRKARDFKTTISLSEEQFAKAVSGKVSKALVVDSAKMMALRNKALAIVGKLPVFTWDLFENEYYGRVRDAADIFLFFDQHIETLRSEQRIKTAQSYQFAKASFLAFKKRVGFHDITADFLKQYQQWMVERGKSITTIGIYVRCLRTIYNIGIGEGIIEKTTQYPFQKKKYAIPAGRNIKKALTLDEVSKIDNYVPVGEGERRAKDMWMLSYLCAGINFKDLAHLRNRDLDGDMLRYIRAKTARTSQSDQQKISVHLTKNALDIINRWRNEDRSSDGYLFPILSEKDDALMQVNKVHQFIKTTNKYMKRIGEQCGLSKQPTTYVARHSAANILKESGASMEQIQDLLGHHSIRTTHAYVGSISDGAKRKLSGLLSPKGNPAPVEPFI